MLLVFVVNNFGLGIVQVALPPLVLSFASAAALGTVMATAAAGMLAGSLVMTIWNPRRERVRAIVFASIVQGLLLLLGGFQPNVALIAAAAFSYMFLSPITFGCSQVIWQSKVAPEAQGRIFAFRRMVAWSSMPVAYLLAGPIADRLFEPLLAADGALAQSVGRFIGVGPGRGTGLLFMILGAATALCLLLLYGYPRLRRLEAELQDAIEDRP